MIENVKAIAVHESQRPRSYTIDWTRDKITLDEIKRIAIGALFFHEYLREYPA